ncbi:MAG: LrgB family protein [Eggerthellaceae bacterium]
MDAHSVLVTILSLALSIGAFAGSVWLNKKVKSSLLNPLLVSVAVIISVLVLLQIPLETYEQERKFFRHARPRDRRACLFHLPATTRAESHFLPVLLGCLAGSVTSMVSAYALCQLLGLGTKWPFPPCRSRPLPP